MSSDGKFFLGVVAVVVLVIAGIVIFGGKGSDTVKEVSRAELEQGVAKGAENAEVTIVEFSDFQCPACKAATEPLHQAVEGNNDVKLVYRHFPLPSHRNGEAAALASEAAKNQGKFWEMHDKLFEGQEVWGSQADPEPIFLQYASELSLNVEKFRSDMSSDAAKKLVKEDKDYALSIDVAQTPTFYVNGKEYTGVQNAEKWKAILEEARSAGND